MKTKIKNNEELRDVIIGEFDKCRAGEIGLDRLKTLTNAFGKSISSAKTDMEYQKFMGQKNKINFLEHRKEND